jgi:hypothetical protein
MKTYKCHDCGKRGRVAGHVPEEGRTGVLVPVCRRCAAARLRGVGVRRGVVILPTLRHPPKA